MRCLVTGASGFVGRHLTAVLDESDVPFLGISRGRSCQNGQAGPHVCCDLLRDLSVMADTVRAFVPDVVIHLAASGVRPRSEASNWDVLHDNLLAALNLLEVCRRLVPEAMVVLLSSSAVYGRSVTGFEPLTEAAPLAPLTNYGLSKQMVEALARQCHRAYGSRVVVARPFNITGPGEDPSFATSAFARQIARIEVGKQEPVVHVGNLDSVRDFTDVRDVAGALLALAQLGLPGETYNICSGIGTSASDVLDGLLRHSTAQPDVVRIKLTHPVDIEWQTGDSSKLQAQTGWQRRYSLNETLREVLEDWRRRTADAGNDSDDDA